ncbi:glycine oxidase ThiO [Candidatus Protofrankia californiensis]|uniref:glycine oxidase ThiO n=1 Tax=Candidatus Protofrankia californiensis TaxID=1839754 RepID=UPI0010410DC3|nr:glycine oxidase ThiO [Candidatus Protofrankia californiensis]
MPAAIMPPGATVVPARAAGVRGWSSPGSRPDVIVAGAGVIGLGVAWRARLRGLTVTVVDPEPGSGASWTAAGMLAPLSELHYGEKPLLALNMASARRYPAFVEELERSSGIEVGYLRCGTLVAAWDGADMAGLRDIHGFARSLGLETELLTRRQLRARVPASASGLAGALSAPDDHQVDNRLLHSALLRACVAEGVTLLPTAARRWLLRGDRVVGLALADGTDLTAPVVVLACGAWSGRIDGLPPGAVPAVRPVKGQTLRLRTVGSPLLTCVLRGSVRGCPVYLVPRADGRIVVGASSEEVGFDVRPRAGAVYELLRDAQALVPGLGEAELEEVSTSLRPASPDNAPLIGPSRIPGLLLAVGHYRNGVLLTPVTADAIAGLLADGALPDEVAAFIPARFDRTEDQAAEDRTVEDQAAADRTTREDVG